MTDIVNRLNDENNYVDAIDDAIEEILNVRGILQRIIEGYDGVGELAAMKLGYAVDDAREYMAAG